jgi:hypothetical protein
MAQAKLDRTEPEEFIGSKKIKEANLKSIVDSIKELLKPFQYDLNLKMEENNGVLSTIRLEVILKNLR